MAALDAPISLHRVEYTRLPAPWRLAAARSPHAARLSPAALATSNGLPSRYVDLLVVQQPAVPSLAFDCIGKPPWPYGRDVAVGNDLTCRIERTLAESHVCRTDLTVSNPQDQLVRGSVRNRHDGPECPRRWRSYRHLALNDETVLALRLGTAAVRGSARRPTNQAWRGLLGRDDEPRQPEHCSIISYEVAPACNVAAVQVDSRPAFGRRPALPRGEPARRSIPAWGSWPASTMRPDRHLHRPTASARRGDHTLRGWASVG